MYDVYKENMIMRYRDQMSCLLPTREKLSKPRAYENHRKSRGDAGERLEFFCYCFFFVVGLIHTLRHD